MAGRKLGHQSLIRTFIMRAEMGRRVLKGAILLAALGAAAIPASAHAGELFGGVYVHDVKTPLDKSGIESGVDVAIGYRSSLPRSVLQPYVFAAVNSVGNTNY